jgi:hypothetical protein
MCIEANVFRISSANRDMHPDYEAGERPLLPAVGGIFLLA